MSEMLDKVAAAIAGDIGLRYYDIGKGEMVACSWDELNGLYRDLYRLQARAAIEAMREATDEMVREGEDASADAITHPGSQEGRETPPLAAWHRMIDAALT